MIDFFDNKHVLACILTGTGNNLITFLHIFQIINLKYQFARCYYCVTVFNNCIKSLYRLHLSGLSIEDWKANTKWRAVRRPGTTIIDA